jgi:hypothetical protein
MVLGCSVMKWLRVRTNIKAGKICPTITMQATRGRGRIPPTHPFTRHYMGLVVNVTLRPRFNPGKAPSTHWLGGPQSLSRHRG